jgi:hypothetical protein
MNNIMKHSDLPNSAVFKLREPNKRELNYCDYSKSSIRLFGMVVVVTRPVRRTTYLRHCCRIIHVLLEKHFNHLYKSIQTDSK